MYFCAKGIDFASTTFYWILELFRQCGMFCFSRLWNCSGGVVCFVFQINIRVDIRFSVHDAFLKSTFSGTFKIERLESQIIKKYLGATKPKDQKQHGQNLLRSPMHNGGEP
jgi:hypothetical protein